MASVGCPLDLYLWSLFIMVWSASVVLEFGLNAYCVLDMILYLMRCVIIWLFMSMSRILAMMGSREIGL